MEKLKSEISAAFAAIKGFAQAAPKAAAIGAIAIASAGSIVGYAIGTPSQSEVRELCRGDGDEMLRQFLGITGEPRPAPGPTPEIPRPTRIQ